MTQEPVSPTINAAPAHTQHLLLLHPPATAKLLWLLCPNPLKDILHLSQAMKLYPRQTNKAGAFVGNICQLRPGAKGRLPGWTPSPSVFRSQDHAQARFSETHEMALALSPWGTNPTRQLRGMNFVLASLGIMCAQLRLH